MDVRTSKLVVVLASVIVLVVTVVAFFGVRQLNDAAPRVARWTTQPLNDELATIA